MKQTWALVCLGCSFMLAACHGPVPPAPPPAAGSALGVTLPATLGGGETVRVERDGRALEFDLTALRRVVPGCAPDATQLRSVARTTDGGAIRYADVADGADVEFRASDGDLAQVVVLREPLDPMPETTDGYLEVVETLRFPPDVRIAEGGADQGFALTDAEGRPWLHVPAPLVWDAASDPARGGSYFAVTLDAPGRATLATRVPLAYLAAAERQYPVSIDPHISGDGPTPDILIDLNESSPIFDTCARVSLWWGPDSIIPWGSHEGSFTIDWGDGAVAPLVQTWDIPYDLEWSLGLYCSDDGLLRHAVRSHRYNVAGEMETTITVTNRDDVTGAITQTLTFPVTVGPGLLDNPEDCDCPSPTDPPPCPPGNACNDGNACTTSDTCDASGFCVGATASCDDGNICTSDGCDPATGCIHVSVADDMLCGDGLACNGDETCQAGVCASGMPPLCDDGGNPCTDMTCDNQVGGCVQTLAPDGTSCPDGLACNGDEACSGGNCMPDPDPPGTCDSACPNYTGPNPCGGPCPLARAPGEPCDFVDASDLDSCTDDQFVCAGANATTCQNAGTDADADGYSAAAASCAGDFDDSDPLITALPPGICPRKVGSEPPTFNMEEGGDSPITVENTDPSDGDLERLCVRTNGGVPAFILWVECEDGSRPAIEGLPASSTPVGNGMYAVSGASADIRETDDGAIAYCFKNLHVAVPLQMDPHDWEHHCQVHAKLSDCRGHATHAPSEALNEYYNNPCRETGYYHRPDGVSDLSPAFPVDSSCDRPHVTWYEDGDYETEFNETEFMHYVCPNDGFNTESHDWVDGCKDAIGVVDVDAAGGIAGLFPDDPAAPPLAYQPSSRGAPHIMVHGFAMPIDSPDYSGTAVDSVDDEASISEKEHITIVDGDNDAYWNVCVDTPSEFALSWKNCEDAPDTTYDGVLHVELPFCWLPAWHWPYPGDEMVVLGDWVLDCNHDGDWAEIHPVEAFAVMRSQDFHSRSQTWWVAARNHHDSGDLRVTLALPFQSFEHICGYSWQDSMCETDWRPWVELDTQWASAHVETASVAFGGEPLDPSDQPVAYLTLRISDRTKSVEDDHCEDANGNTCSCEAGAIEDACGDIDDEQCFPDESCADDGTDADDMLDFRGRVYLTWQRADVDLGGQGYITNGCTGSVIPGAVGKSDRHGLLWVLLGAVVVGVCLWRRRRA